MLARILSAVCSGRTSLERENLLEGVEVGNPTSSNNNSTNDNNANSVRLIAALKNALVGDETSKILALRLGIVEELLKILDSAELEEGDTSSDGEDDDGGENCGGLATGYLDDITLHAMGLFAILAPLEVARDAFAMSGAQIIAHIARALRTPSEKVRSTALRAMTGMCQGIIPLAESSFALTKLWGVPGLLEVAQLVLEDVSGTTWSPTLRVLGSEMLASITRDAMIAKNLASSVVSTATSLLRPILPWCSSELQGSYGKSNAAGLVDSGSPRETSLLLELLFNLSSGNPAVLVPWLMGCAPEYSSWGALKGLEVNMNHRDEQIRILAALVLVNCTIAVGDLKGGEDASDVRVPMPPPSPSSFAGSEDLEDGTPQALDAVIDHRVLQLFVRTLRSWASLPVLPSSCSPEPAAMDCPACDYAGAIARATQDVAERRTPQRLREAVAFGVVDALIAWLRRARMVEIAGMGTPVLSLSEVEDQHSSRAHSRVAPSSTGRASATGVTPTGVASALSALAALCANCDEARERVVALEFHYSLDFWLRATDPNKQSAWRDDDSLEDELESQDGGMGCDSVVCSALELVRNLGRSSVACSALAGAGVHLSLISHYLLASEEEGEEEEEEEEEYSKAQAVASLAAAGLANMSLEHGVVKEAITSSECLQRACDFAVDEDVDEEKRVEALAILRSTCFLAALDVRLRVTRCLGGVEGMVTLIRAPQPAVALQGIQMLRNLLHAVPLRVLVSPFPSCGGGEAGSRWGLSPEQEPFDPSAEESGEGIGGMLAGSFRVVDSRGSKRHQRGEYLAGGAGSIVPQGFWASPSRLYANSAYGADDMSPMEVEWHYGERVCRGGQGTEEGLDYETCRAMQDDRNAGLVSLIEEVVSRLEVSPVAGGCDETSSAALHLLHVLSAADNPQRAVLRTPRVLHVITPFLLPDGAKSRIPNAAGLDDKGNGISISGNIWGGEWSGRSGSKGTRWHVHGARVSQGWRSEFSPPWGATPPCVSADVAARLLLAQLLPERSNEISAALAVATSAAVSAAVAAAGRGAMGGEGVDAARERGSGGSSGDWAGGIGVEELDATGRWMGRG